MVLTESRDAHPGVPQRLVRLRCARADRQHVEMQTLQMENEDARLLARRRGMEQMGHHLHVQEEDVLKDRRVLAGARTDSACRLHGRRETEPRIRVHWQGPDVGRARYIMAGGRADRVHTHILKRVVLAAGRGRRRRRGPTDSVSHLRRRRGAMAGTQVDHVHPRRNQSAKASQETVRYVVVVTNRFAVPF